MSSQTIIDEALVERCQKELPYETKSFERLVTRYQEKVFQKAVSVLKNRDEALDVGQDVFIKVFLALPSFRADAKFSTWLYAITVNTCLNHKEKMQRRPWWWLSEDIDELHRQRELEQSLFYVMSEGMEREETADRIEEAISRLSSASQSVMRLRFYEELDYREIANRLGIGLSATKMRLKRARHEFKKSYQELEVEAAK